MQLLAYQHAIDALRQAPLPRVVLVFSRGVAFSPELDARSLLDPMLRAAAEAQVQFYALTEAAEDVDVSVASEGGQAAKRQEGRFLISGLQTVASAAGGEAFVVVGTADRLIHRIERETSAFYHLGVEIPVSADTGRPFSTTVSVRRPGVTVRVNRHAFAAGPAADPVPLEDRLQTALARGGVRFGVPMALAMVQRRDPSLSEFQVAVHVQLPETVAGPLVAMYGVADSKGEVVQAGRKNVPAPQSGPYHLVFPIPLSRGEYRLRFLVADAFGNIGSIEHPFTVDIPKVGSFWVSDLFTTWSGADQRPRLFALETIPDGAESLTTSLELYPNDPANVPDVTVRMVMFAVGSETPLYEQEVTPQILTMMRLATAQFPVAQLAAGAYVIRATVVERGAVRGTVSMTIRKAGGSLIPF
jgi:hypothetical protein